MSRGVRDASGSGRVGYLYPITSPSPPVASERRGGADAYTASTADSADSADSADRAEGHDGAPTAPCPLDLGRRSCLGDRHPLPSASQATNPRPACRRNDAQGGGRPRGSFPIAVASRLPAGHGTRKKIHAECIIIRLVTSWSTQRFLKGAPIPILADPIPIPTPASSAPSKKSDRGPIVLPNNNNPTRSSPARR